MADTITSTSADISALARALGDATRLGILLALADGPLAVGELVQRLGQPQPKVSNHLAVLRTAGLVASRRERRTVVNELASEGVGALATAVAALRLDAPAASESRAARRLAAVEALPMADAPPAGPAHAPGAHAPPERETRVEGPRELIVFVLGGGEYALPIEAVREIVRHVRPRPLPRAAPDVLGIVQVQGRLLEVIDVRARLGLPAEAEPKELVVVEGAGRTAAMPVEAVREMVRVAPAELLPPPVASPELDVVAAVGERLILVLRPDQIVAERRW